MNEKERPKYLISNNLSSLTQTTKEKKRKNKLKDKEVKVETDFNGLFMEKENNNLQQLKFESVFSYFESRRRGSRSRFSFSDNSSVNSSNSNNNVNTMTAETQTLGIERSPLNELGNSNSNSSIYNDNSSSNEMESSYISSTNFAEFAIMKHAVTIISTIFIVVVSYLLLTNNRNDSNYINYTSNKNNYNYSSEERKYGSYNDRYRDNYDEFDLNSQILELSQETIVKSLLKQVLPNKKDDDYVEYDNEDTLNQSNSNYFTLSNSLIKDFFINKYNQNTNSIINDEKSKEINQHYKIENNNNNNNNNDFMKISNTIKNNLESKYNECPESEDCFKFHLNRKNKKRELQEKNMKKEKTNNTNNTTTEKSTENNNEKTEKSNSNNNNNNNNNIKTYNFNDNNNNNQDGISKMMDKLLMVESLTHQKFKGEWSMSLEESEKISRKDFNSTLFKNFKKNPSNFKNIITTSKKNDDNNNIDKSIITTSEVSKKGSLRLAITKESNVRYGINILLFDGEYMDRWIRVEGSCYDTPFQITSFSKKHGNEFNISIKEKASECFLINDEEETITNITNSVDNSNITNNSASSDYINNKRIFLSSNYAGSYKKGKSFTIDSNEPIQFKVNFHSSDLNFNNMFYKNTNNIETYHGIIQFTLPSGENIKLNFNMESYNGDDAEERDRLYIYCTLMLLLSMLMTRNSINILRQISLTPGITANISVIGLASNVIWGTLYCLLNINLTTSISKINYFLVVPTVMFILNFGWLEIRILIKTIEAQWSTQANQSSNSSNSSNNSNNLNSVQNLRKSISVFFMKLYCMMFITMYFFTYFLINKYFTTLSILILWTPQIISNVVYNNRLSFPLSYLLMNTLVRLFFVIYIRGFSLNIFRLEPDYWLIAFSVTLASLQLIVIYSQSLLGARWFIPFSFTDTKFKYLNFEQLQQRERYKSDVDCIICLSPFSEPVQFSDTENTNNTTTNTHAHTNDNTNNINNINNINNLNASFEHDDNISTYTDLSNLSNLSNVSNSSNNSVLVLTRERILEKFLSIDLKKSFYDFHKFEFNIDKQDYVETDCGHLFHTICLEKWLNQRRECPSCRSISMME